MMEKDSKSYSGRKLDVLAVGPMPPRTGGSCFVTNETLVGLASRGNYVRCISQFSNEDLNNENYDISWRGSGVEVYPVVADFVPSSQRLSDEERLRRSADIEDKLDQLIDERRPDVVMVAHESYAQYANEVVRKKGVPVVQVLHGTPTHLIGEGKYPEDLTQKYLEAVGQATLVVGVSDYLANVVRKRGIKQTTYIHNGTDTEHFKPIEKPNLDFLKSLGLTLEDKVVLHASTLRSVKRPLDIVESAPYSLDKDPDLMYVIVGEGPLRKEMEDRVVELGLEDRFRFTGAIDYSNIPSYFQHADMFLLPSQNEGFGRVLREAQACKTVPIASDIGPVREVIDPEKTGRVFGVSNVKELAKKVSGLSRDNEHRNMMAQRGWEVAIANNLRSMIGKYESVLSNPLSHIK